MAKKTTAKDCWVTVENKVYNLTKFIRKHPDREAILDCAGGALDPALGLNEEDIEDHCIGYLIELKKDK